jgi:hypothetical protein
VTVSFIVPPDPATSFSNALRDDENTDEGVTPDVMSTGVTVDSSVALGSL